MSYRWDIGGKWGAELSGALVFALVIVTGFVFSVTFGNRSPGIGVTRVGPAVQGAPVKAVPIDIAALPRRNRAAMLAASDAQSGRPPEIARDNAAGGNAPDTSDTPDDMRPDAATPARATAGHSLPASMMDQRIRAFTSTVPPVLANRHIGNWQLVSTISEKEITEKRQKIASGERLYKRVIVKRDEFGRATDLSKKDASASGASAGAQGS